jgi:hypothetical protein
VPQLTFNKDICPKRISVQLIWDQTADRWHLECYMYAQTEMLQESVYGYLPEAFSTIEVCMMIARTFEDWIDVTPGYTASALKKALKALCPPEVPTGLDPRRDLRPTPSAGRKRQDRPPVWHSTDEG